MREKLEMVFPSRLDYLGVLVKVAEGLQGPLNLTDEETYAVSTALMEAGTNAIQHGGNPGNAPVRIVLEGDEQQVVMAVEDEGHGFDLSRVDTNITALDHLYNSRGRGIFNMRSVMDEVNFSFGRERGTRVTLVLKRKANGR